MGHGVFMKALEVPVGSGDRFYGHVLETFTCAKYFGVDISNGLFWCSHIDMVTGSATKTLNFARRNIKTKHPGVREMGYKTRIC